MGGLSLKFKTEARSAEVLNFNERPTSHEVEKEMWGLSFVAN